MKSLPESSVVARHRLVDKMTFGAIAEKYEVSRQAVHKCFVRWAKANDVDWKTRRTQESI